MKYGKRTLEVRDSNGHQYPCPAMIYKELFRMSKQGSGPKDNFCRHVRGGYRKGSRRLNKRPGRALAVSEKGSQEAFGLKSGTGRLVGGWN